MSRSILTTLKDLLNFFCRHAAHRETRAEVFSSSAIADFECAFILGSLATASNIYNAFFVTGGHVSESNTGTRAAEVFF